MNDFSELEAELKKLRARPVSPELAVRVERALEQSDAAPQTAGVIKHRRIHSNWLPLGLGLAAAAAFLVLARVNVDRAPKSSRTTASNQQTAATPAPNNLRPVDTTASFVPAGLTQVVYNTRDEGLHFPTGASQPMRRIRSRKSETLQWNDPQSGASLRVTYPAEEVTLTPISGQ